MGQDSEVNIIILNTLILALLSVFLLIFFLLYRQKRNAHFQKLEQLSNAFIAESAAAKAEIQEEIYKSVSEEIHDNVGQLLSLASMQLNLAMQQDPKPYLNDIKNNIDTALKDLRNMAKSLNGTYLQQLSLIRFLQWQQEQCQSGTKITYDIVPNGVEKSISDSKKIIVFRTLQECFQNVIKHAKATAIKVTVTFHENHTEINYHDNGIGFAMPLAEAMHGMGLQNIRNRISLIGGSVSIMSVINQGTTIQLTIPYE